MAANSHIQLERAGSVAIITLNNPRKLNALTKDDFYELASCLNKVAMLDEVVVTLLIGRGRFFSSGADVSVSRQQPPGTDLYRHGLTMTVASNLNLARSFYMHPKILVTALNGPVVGMPAALVACSDFIFCVPGTYLHTPFTSLGLVAEGCSSLTFVERLGVSKANEALIAGKKLSSQELLGAGFVNQIFACSSGEDFKERVLQEIAQMFHKGLNPSSMLKIKDLIRQKSRRELDSQNVEEVFSALARNVDGIPQKQFEKLRTAKKAHRL